MADEIPSTHRASFSRRRFLKGLGALSATVSAGGLRAPDLADAEEEISVPPDLRSSVTLHVNGVERHLQVANRTTLLEALRDELSLTGAKLGCGEGHCGACTVLLDGQPCYSCSQLAVLAEGRRILTVEGLEKDGHLDPLQQSFIDADAMQCGYCTPGQIMSARALLDAVPAPTSGDVRQALCGNLCRCGAYVNILKAVLAAAGKHG